MRTTVRLSNAREVPATEPVDSRDPIEVGSRLQLFLDDHLVESMRGLEFLRHIPQSAGSVFSFDQPWEGNTSLPLTVLRDGELCRLYYVGRSISDYLGPGELKPEETLVPNHPHLLCCAESRDGVEWTRPVVGVYEFDGCKENNILGNPVGFPFLDTRPEVDPSERYKAVAEVHIGSSDEEEMGVVLWVSPDGLRWRKWRDEPLFITSLPNAFNSINVLFWCESEDHYVFYFRYIAQGVRTFARTTSKDLRQWSEPVPCTFGGEVRPADHLYTNAATPYFRAPHIYLAFPQRFLPWRRYHADALIPGVSETLLLASRDGVDWGSPQEALIRPGIDERNWVSRTNAAVAGILQTSENEISLYVGRHYSYPSIHLERFVLRTDGFASVNAPFSGGELLTRPLLIDGDNLVLNYSTSAAGSIRIEIQDAEGNPIPGFKLEQSPLIFGDQIAGTVGWERPDPMMLSRLGEKPIRLRFLMKDANLYSFRFMA